MYNFLKLKYRCVRPFVSIFYKKCIIFLKEKDEPDLGGWHTDPNNRLGSVRLELCDSPKRYSVPSNNCWERYQAICSAAFFWLRKVSILDSIKFLQCYKLSKLNQTIHLVNYVVKEMIGRERRETRDKDYKNNLGGGKKRKEKQVKKKEQKWKS